VTKKSELKLRVYRITENGQIVASDWEHFLADYGNDERLYWVDILSANELKLGELFNDINLDPIILERCMDAESVSGVFSYEKLLILQMPIASDWGSCAHVKFTIMCCRSALIIVHMEGSLNWHFHPPRNNEPIKVATLLYSLLDGLIDRTTALTLQARRDIEQLELDIEEADDDDDDEIRRQILRLKRAVAYFDMGVESKHHTMVSLLSHETNIIEYERTRERLRDVATHLEHSLRYIERMEDRLAELYQHYLLMLQDRANNRLRILTILSAIFMPLTLVTGIYGMNFKNMPELGWYYGYPATLLLMVGIMLVLVVYFFIKGWFR